MVVLIANTVCWLRQLLAHGPVGYTASRDHMDAERHRVLVSGGKPSTPRPSRWWTLQAPGSDLARAARAYSFAIVSPGMTGPKIAPVLEIGYFFVIVSPVTKMSVLCARRRPYSPLVDFSLPLVMSEALS